MKIYMGTRAMIRLPKINTKEKIEFIKNFFKSRNAELLSDFISAGQEMKYKCNICNQVCYTNWRTYYHNKHGCPYCNNKKVYEGNSLAHKYPKVAKEWHPNKNDKLTPYDFVFGSGESVWWKCSKCQYEWKGRICTRTISDHNCKKCARVIIGQKRKKYNINDIRKIFAERGYTLITDHYDSVAQIMEYICPFGIKHEIEFNAFYNKKQDCKCFAKEKISAPQRHSQAKVAKEFSDKGCLLKSKYINLQTPLLYVCKCGNKSTKSLGNFRKKPYCNYCNNHKRYTLGDVKEIFKSKDCILLESNYINNVTSMKFICSCGEIDVVNLASFFKGIRCNKCKKNNLSSENHWNWNTDRDKIKEYKRFGRWIRSNVRKYMKLFNESKNDKSYKILGYTSTQLQQYIKSHPNWDIVKNKDWTIDHIFPINAFFKHKINNIKIINSLDNLQPMERKENISKSDNYDLEKFIQWLSNKGITLG